jgi:hypothetical protein
MGLYLIGKDLVMVEKQESKLDNLIHFLKDKWIETGISWKDQRMIIDGKKQDFTVREFEEAFEQRNKAASKRIANMRAIYGPFYDMPRDEL